MKRLVFKIAIFIGVLFILDFAIGKTLRHFYFKEIAGFKYCLTYAIDSTKADVVVLGGSRAKYQYISDVFEDSLKMSFYNCGGEGPATFYQLAILKSILKRYSPKVIIMDFKGTFAEGKDGQDCYNRIIQILPYYKPHKEIRKIIELRDPYEKLKQLSQIYPFNSEVLTIIMGDLKIDKKRNADDKGFFPRYGQWQDKIDTARNIKPYIVDTNKLNALREFIRIAKKSGADVFVIYTPVYERYEREPQEIGICRNVCASNNVPFWNLCQDTTFLNKKYLFFDIDHLNPQGAMIFSKLLAHRLKNYMEQSK